ncbi:hypothetical protein PGT21_006258 [Puccinia graminis f. sp. tritici]|uniref:Uncharacterized protein n=2 Tax=Puccinia graminis f. sp. tritici TaxID=56615 RepID=A0A5B0LSU2_PUCGR|nr:hypothetical protein PGT21_006258 [Puccinia graminis f. sp. tritici]
MIFFLLLISLCPIPTTLGAFIEKAVESHLEGRKAVHYLSDKMSTAYPAPLEPSKETSGNPQLPPTEILQALTLNVNDLSKGSWDHVLLDGGTSSSPPITSQEMTENLKVRENWKNNEEKLFLLYHDSIDLEKIYKQIVDSGEFSLPLIFFSNHALNLEGEVDPSRAHRNVIEFKKKIEIFKKVKFWELGNFSSQYLNSTGTTILNLLLENQKDYSIPNWIQNLPPQILASIPKEIWKKYALVFVNQVQDYIKQIEPNYVKCSAAIQYLFPLLFKTIDFLYKQEFIDDKAIKFFFKDREILLKIAHPCTYDIFQKRYSHMLRPTHPCSYDPFRKHFSHMMQSFIDIKENWFWPFGFKFYNALSKQELLWIKFDILNACMVDAFWKALDEEGTPELQEWLIVSKLFDEKNDGRRSMILNLKNDPTNSDIKIQGEFDVEVEQLIKVLKRVYVKDHTLLIDYKQREVLMTAICEMLYFIDMHFSQGIIREQSKKPGIDDEHFEEKFQLILTSTRFLNLADLAIEYKKMCKSDAIEFSNSYPFHNNYINLPYADKIKITYDQFKKMYLRVEERQDELANWLKDQKDMKSLLNIEELKFEYKKIFHEMGII